MAVLSDKDIKKAIKEKRIKIKNVDKKNISVASIDLRLDKTFRVFKHTEMTHIDSKKGLSNDLTELIKIKKGKPFTIHPGELVLASTIEYVKMPDDLIARLDGRSSLGRLGLVIHSTAGSVDPGFEGQLTLELANISKLPVSLWPGMKICRITFEELSSPSKTPYNKRKGSKYLKQKGPGSSKIKGKN